MKLYLVWAFDHYYPTGPSDLMGIFDNKPEAEALVEKLKKGITYGWGTYVNYFDVVKMTEETFGVKE